MGVLLMGEHFVMVEQFVALDLFLGKGAIIKHAAAAGEGAQGVCGDILHIPGYGRLLHHPSAADFCAL